MSSQRYNLGLPYFNLPMRRSELYMRPLAQFIKDIKDYQRLLGIRVFPSLPLSQLATLSCLCLALDSILPSLFPNSELITYPENSILRSDDIEISRKVSFGRDRGFRSSHMRIRRMIIARCIHAHVIFACSSVLTNMCSRSLLH